MKGAIDFKNTVSKTQQNFRESTNINKIVQKARKYRVDLSQLGNNSVFGDVSGLGDFHSTMNKVAQINQIFDKLPAKVRARFRNDPAEVITFLQDPANDDQARELGLLRPLTAQELQEKSTIESASATPKG